MSNTVKPGKDGFDEKGLPIFKSNGINPRGFEMWHTKLPMTFMLGLPCGYDWTDRDREDFFHHVYRGATKAIEEFRRLLAQRDPICAAGMGPEDCSYPLLKGADEVAMRFEKISYNREGRPKDGKTSTPQKRKRTR